MGVVNVIGAGPVGLHCAGLLAKEGFEVTVFEEHSAIGRPVQCAGLISKAGVEELEIELGNSVVNEIKGAKIFSQNGESITVRRPGTMAYVVDRYLFDQMFYKKAKRARVEIRTDNKLIDLRNNSLFMQSHGRGELIKSKVTIGADGSNSVVRHSVFPELLKKEFVHAFQIRTEGKFDKEFVEIHFGEFAPGFFAWIVPESTRIARIGIGVRLGENAAEALQEFVKKRQLNPKILSKSSALIPISPPVKELVAGSALLVGDAAAQTKATTGGGLIFGLKAGQACADTVGNHLKHQQPLSNYSRNLQAVNKELALHWKIYSYIHGMAPRQFDSIIAKAKNAGIEQFLEEHGNMDKPSLFMRKVLFKPKMWSLLPAALKMI